MQLLQKPTVALIEEHDLAVMMVYEGVDNGTGDCVFRASDDAYGDSPAAELRFKLPKHAPWLVGKSYSCVVSARAER